MTSNAAWQSDGPTFSEHVRRQAGRALSWLVSALVFCWLVFALAVLVLRYVVLPGIDHYRGEIEELASSAAGHRITIERVEAGWDGLNPELHLKGVRLFDRQGGESLSFREVSAVIAWRSAVLLMPQFHRLHAEGPVLHAKRTADGQIVVAGFPFSPKGAGDPALADWLLGQEHISIAGATVLWQDALRGAAELRLEKVSLQIQNDGQAHRFALSAIPVGPAAGAIELKGELFGTSMTRPEEWHGQVYVDAGNVDLAAWSHWIDWPVDIRRGRGSLRAWGTLVAGLPEELSVDLALSDVDASLDETLPPLDLLRLSGRLTVSRDPLGKAAGGVVGGHRMGLRGLDVSLALRDGTTIRPTGFHLQWSALKEGGTQGLGIVTEADLGELAAAAAYLPLAPGIRDALVGYAPSGTLNNLQFSWSGAARGLRVFSVKTGFSNLSLAAAGNVPGFDGLDGTLVADEKGGALQVESGPLALDFPAVFPGDAALLQGKSKLGLDELSVKLDWTMAETATGKVIEFNLQHARFSGPDGGGEAQGRYRWVSPVAGEKPNPGEIDLTAHFAHINAASIWRFLPHGVSADVRHWVKDSVRAGSVPSADLILKGPLAEFPFRNYPGGQFLLKASLKGAELRYDKDWPVVEGLDADLKFEGSSLSVLARQSATVGMPLARVEARIDDFLAPSVGLSIKGEVQGELAGFFRFLDQSPLGETLGHFYEHILIDGEGRLNLDLSIPLDRPAKARVKGQFDLSGSQVRIDPLLPPVTQMAGRVIFSERSAQTTELGGMFLGRPVSVSLRADGKEVRVAASGDANVEQLKQYYGKRVSDSLPLFDRLSGALPWHAAVLVKDGRVRIGVESSLVGLASTLPAPLAKSAERVLPVHFERMPLPSERRGKVLRDQFKVSLGDLASATLIRRSETRAGSGSQRVDLTTVERGLLVIAESVGKATESSAMPDTGLRVLVRQSAVDLDAWRAVLARPAGTPAVASPALQATSAPPANPVNPVNPESSSPRSDIDWPTPQFDIEAKTLRLLGRQWRDVKLSARPREGGLAGRIEARDMSGAWIWEPAGKGTFRARLAQLVLPDEKPANGGGSAPANGGATNGHGADRSGAPDSLPALDIIAEEFVLGSRPLGKVELMAENEASVWKVSHFALDNKDGKVAATGRWITGANGNVSAQKTEVEFALEAGNIGLFLARFGFPDAIHQGKGALEGQLAWKGSPLSINQPTLSGRLKVKAENGQFNKLEPGFGKLLSILSLQTLPRRVVLDFRDVFSEGFAFDAVTGSTVIADGVMRTNDMVIEGVPAKVLMKGEVDLGRDTQNLRVTVQPEIGGTLALGAAVVVNPVVGVAALLAQKVFRDPLNKAFAFEYQITGSLTDPKVEKVGGPPPAANAKNASPAVPTGKP